MQRLRPAAGGETELSAGYILGATRHGGIAIGGLIAVVAAYRGLILATGSVVLSAGDGASLTAIGIILATTRGRVDGAGSVANATADGCVTGAGGIAVAAAHRGLILVTGRVVLSAPDGAGIALKTEQGAVGDRAAAEL